MTGNIMHALGGIGLFLIGMTMLTDGLRGLAGRTLRDLLARFTGTALSGAAAGAAITAVIQSSSATTVMVVGFVSAGLITFPQALGVIFGANLGTTATGWIVAILGFKLHLGEAVLPLIFAAAFMKMFAAGRTALLGTTLAGFGLLFVGIEVLQEGMAALQGIVTPAHLPGDSLLGRVELVLLGALVTAVTQSSSAGVAAALAALGAGTISFPQAAAMVIGMNLGTTVTALLATLGGSAATRRTGYAHLIFNLLTGALAFALLGPFTRLIETAVSDSDPLIGLVAFHTAFNILGLVLFLPFTAAFARLVTRLVRERGPMLTRRLGPTLLRDADAATDAATATVEAIARAHFAYVARRLSRTRPRRSDQAELRDIADALAAARAFIARIAPGEADSPRAHRIAAALHMLDHLGRLYFRCTQAERLATLGTERRLIRLRGVLRDLAAEAAEADDPARSAARLNRLRRILRAQRDVFRDRIIALASTGSIDDEAAFLRADAVRWLHRVSYHLWRIQHHLTAMREAALPASPRREAAVEVLQD